MLDRLPGGRDRSETHHLRLHPADADPRDPCEGFEAERERLFFAHEQGCRNSVVGRAGVPGRDHDVLAAEALDAAERIEAAELFCRRARPDALVAVEGDGLPDFFLHPVPFLVEDGFLDFEWNDLVLVDAGLVGGRSLLVTPGGELVEFAARQAVALGHVLARLHHRLQRRRIEDGVREGHREVLAVIGRHVSLCRVQLEELRVEIRDARGLRGSASAETAPHSLDSQGDPAVACANGDRHDDAVEGLHARAALAVRVEGADLHWKPGEASDVSQAHEFTLAADVSEPDILDHGVADLGVAIEERAQNLGAGIVEASGDELATAAACEGRADSVHENDIARLHLGGFL